MHGPTHTVYHCAFSKFYENRSFTMNPNHTTSLHPNSSGSLTNIQHVNLHEHWWTTHTPYKKSGMWSLKKNQHNALYAQVQLRYCWKICHRTNCFCPVTVHTWYITHKETVIKKTIFLLHMVYTVTPVYENITTKPSHMIKSPRCHLAHFVIKIYATMTT